MCLCRFGTLAELRNPRRKKRETRLFLWFLPGCDGLLGVCFGCPKRAFMASEKKKKRLWRGRWEMVAAVYLSLSLMAETPHRHFYWWFQHGFPPWTFAWQPQYSDCLLTFFLFVLFCFLKEENGTALLGAPSPCSPGKLKKKRGRETVRFTLGWVHRGRSFPVLSTDDGVDMINGVW